jgi:hypothetical protein
MNSDQLLKIVQQYSLRRYDQARKKYGKPNHMSCMQENYIE